MAKKAPRRLKRPVYSHFKLAKKIVHPAAKLPSSLRLFSQTIGLLASRPKLFGGFLLTFALLSILLVRGLAGGVDLPAIKATVNEAFGGQLNQLGSAVALLGYLGSASATPASEGAVVIQNILLLVVSLALIWLLRQVAANKLASVRLAFYNGMYPLIPFILVLVVIGLQTTPAILGNALVGIVFSGGLAVTLLEKWLWGVLIGLLITLTLYMLSSSIFALYIVSLPGTTPLLALRSARQLVLHRRLIVMRRLLGLPIIGLGITLLIMLPLIIYWPAVAGWVFYGLGLAFLVVGHTYIYNLYRELLRKS